MSAKTTSSKKRPYLSPRKHQNTKKVKQELKKKEEETKINKEEDDDFEEAKKILLSSESDESGVYYNGGWDDVTGGAYTLNEFGGSLISKDIFNRLRQANILGGNVLIGFKARRFHPCLKPGEKDESKLGDLFYRQRPFKTSQPESHCCSQCYKEWKCPCGQEGTCAFDEPKLKPRSVCSFCKYILLAVKKHNKASKFE